jgi:hypothetical protein
MNANRAAWIAIGLICLSAPARAEDRTSGVYCRDEGQSMFAVKRNSDSSIELRAVTETSKYGGSSYSFYGHAKASSPGHWVIGPGSYGPDDRCIADVQFSGAAWTIADRNDCSSHRGGHGPYSFPAFRLADHVKPLTKPDVTQEDCKPGTRHPGVAQREKGEPLDIVRRMYGDVLSDSHVLVETSPADWSRYFVPAIAHIITGCLNSSDCLLEIEFSGNAGPHTDEMRKTLSIEQLSDDGAHAVIQSKFVGYGKGETRRFEFTKAGNAWKISDVVYPDGHRLSKTGR